MRIATPLRTAAILASVLMIGGTSNPQAATTTGSNVAPAPAAPKRTAAPIGEVEFQSAALADNANEPYAAGYGGGFGSASVYRAAAARDTVPPILVHFSSTDPLGAQNMEEDLAIMNHILDQALERGLGEDDPPSRLGVPLLYTSTGRASRALYLADFGALFMIKVNMPLMPPLAPEEEKPLRSAADSEWESAKREVLGLGPKPGSLMISVTVPDITYDPEQVDTLKRSLMGALKNASNIRGLKPDDYVTIAVFGQPVPLAVRALSSSASASDASENSATSKPRARSSRKSSSKSTTAVIPADALASGAAAQKGTVLTLRVKTSDIVTFAQGKLSFEEFSQKVTSTTYAGSGYGITSVNSWIQSGRSLPNVR